MTRLLFFYPNHCTIEYICNTRQKTFAAGSSFYVMNFILILMHRVYCLMVLFPPLIASKECGYHLLTVTFLKIVISHSQNWIKFSTTKRLLKK